jgi:hypothetical protein
MRPNARVVSRLGLGHFEPPRPAPVTPIVSKPPTPHGDGADDLQLQSSVSDAGFLLTDLVSRRAAIS